MEALRDAVIEAKPLGLCHAKLTGGEPLLHPRFVGIVDMLTAEGLQMNMETNGTLMTAELGRHLKEKTNVSFISISLDGADAKTHDRFRGVVGAYDAALRGLAHLTDAGYSNVQVIMSVHRGNLDQIDGLVRLVADRGAGSVKFNPVSFAGRGTTMHERGETLDYEERMALAAAVREELPETFLHPPHLLSSTGPEIHAAPVGYLADSPPIAGSATFWASWGRGTLPCAGSAGPSPSWSTGNWGKTASGRSG